MMSVDCSVRARKRSSLSRRAFNCPMCSCLESEEKVLGYNCTANYAAASNSFSSSQRNTLLSHSLALRKSALDAAPSPDCR